MRAAKPKTKTTNTPDERYCNNLTQIIKGFCLSKATKLFNSNKLNPNLVHTHIVDNKSNRNTI